MRKVIPKIKVSDAGCYSRKQIREMSIEEKQRIGLIMSSGSINRYRYSHD